VLLFAFIVVVAMTQNDKTSVAFPGLSVRSIAGE